MQKQQFGSFQAYTFGSDDLKVTVMEYGARILSVNYCGKELLMQYPEAADYIEDGAYAGAVVGRTANRIRGASCTIGGRVCSLTANLGAHHFHGGIGNFSNRIWRAECEGERIRFSLDSSDGENGYPGNLEAAVTYAVQGNSLTIVFEGKTDRETLYAPTTHLYFEPEDKGDVRNCLLQMDADQYFENDGDQIPAGDPREVSGIWDFRKEKPIRESFDNCFLLKENGQIRLTLGSIRVLMETDFPGLQLYTGNGLSGKLKDHQGIALEPGFVPDAVHHPDQAQPVLKPGEHFMKYIKYTMETI